MTLWDAFSGKIYNWNNTKEEADKQVRRGLSEFLAVNLADGQHPQMVSKAVDHLLSYYLASCSSLDASLDESLVDYKRALFSLSVANRLRLICAMHMTYVTSIFVANKDDSFQMAWWVMQSDGMMLMYGRNEHYVQGWIDRIPWLSESEDHQSSRLSGALYDEIAPLLGLKSYEIVAAFDWFSQTCLPASLAKDLRESLEWKDIVSDCLGGE